jgi:hypothetical protein
MSSKILLIFWFGLAVHLGARDCKLIRTVPIRLLNEAAIHPKLVAAAQREAAYVLKSLCVELEWTAEPLGNALDLRITAAPIGSGITNHSLGVAFLDKAEGNRGTVFTSRVRAVQQMYGPLVNPERLLGCVLAHEIGHLLLGGRTHSREGIMVANFGRADLLKAAQRQLLFTHDDRKMLFSSQMARRSYSPADVLVRPKQ